MAREGGWREATSVCHHLLKEGQLPGGELRHAGLWAFSEIFESSRRGGAGQGDPAAIRVEWGRGGHTPWG